MPFLFPFKRPYNSSSTFWQLHEVEKLFPVESSNKTVATGDREMISDTGFIARIGVFYGCQATWCM